MVDSWNAIMEMPEESEVTVSPEKASPDKAHSPAKPRHPLPMGFWKG